MPGGPLHLAEWNALEKSDGDVGTAQCVRGDPMADSSTFREAPDDRCGVVSSHRVVPSVEEQRPFGSFSDGFVDGLVGAGIEHDLRGLVALADDVEGGLVAESGEIFDACAAGFGDAQAVESE